MEGDAGRAARRWALPGAVIAAAVLPLLVLAPDSGMGIVWPLLLEAAAVVVLVVATARMPAGARAVWWGLAASQVLTFIGDLIYDAQAYGLGQEPFPGWADPVYFASYAAEITALVALTRARHPQRDREQVLDAAIMTLPIAAVVGAFVILPMLSSTADTVSTVAAIAYPLLDLLMLAGLIRLLVGGGRPNRALALVTASVSVVLAADLVYNGLAAQGLVQDTPGWVQAMFSLAVLLMAAASCSRDAASIVEPAADRGQLLSSPRLVALGLGTIALPILLACGFGLDISAGVRLLALASIVVNLLVVWRAVLLVRLVRRQRDELAALARTDALTGIPNRRSWDYELERRAARVRVQGEPLAVAVLDLDHFKRFNDEHGHQSGDLLLTACAQAWSAALPAGAYLARYGGEEFAALIPVGTPEGARAALEGLRHATPAAVTVSIGAAMLDPSLPALSSVAAADDALYVAKARGRDQVVVQASRSETDASLV
jgi:diguanylate cyclase (GGDEF)-like protein